MATENQAKKKDRAIIETARKRFKLAEHATDDIRKSALEDMDFRAGEQWPEAIKRQRAQDGRPTLTINRLPQYLRQITNDQRQNRPSIKVAPVDSSADVETAKIYQGLIRHIEYNSNADVAYDSAFNGAASKGFGFFRVITDYVNPDSFDQEILIEPVANDFAVYIDPASQKPDACDANWALIFEDLDKEDYEEAYGDSELASMDNWRALGDDAPGWLSDNKCRIAEYFYKEIETVDICQITDLDQVVTVEKSELERVGEGYTYQGRPVEVINERKTKKPVIHHLKINALEVLERSIWPGKYIPIIPVYGDELNINGKKILEGVIRHAKDPQRMYNYWASAETEAIALAPRAPFIGPKGSFDGFQNQWKSANQKNIPFLEYNPQNHAGQALPPPTRNAYEPPVAAITNARMQSNEDLKATTGIYDASLGARSNENSGIAIQRRNQQAQTNNFHFIDNLSRSLRHLGRILVDLIPHIYDTARTVRILGEDGQAKMVVINSVFEKDGEKKVIDLGHGKYDVTVSTGPSYATKRQEAADTILEFIRVYPNAAPIIGDLLAKNFDWPGADEIAERLKKSLPQEFQEQAEGQKIPPQIQAQLQQMTQMNEQLTQALNQAQDKLEKDTLKYQDSQRDRESKERIEQAKIEASLHKLLAEMDADDARFLLKEELAQINQNQKTAGAPFGAALADEIENPIGGVSPSTLMEV